MFAEIEEKTGLQKSLNTLPLFRPPGKNICKNLMLQSFHHVRTPRSISFQLVVSGLDTDHLHYGSGHGLQRKSRST